jgi:hypothetical protein
MYRFLLQDATQSGSGSGNTGDLSGLIVDQIQHINSQLLVVTTAEQQQQLQLQQQQMPQHLMPQQQNFIQHQLSTHYQLQVYKTIKQSCFGRIKPFKSVNPDPDRHQPSS